MGQTTQRLTDLLAWRAKQPALVRWLFAAALLAVALLLRALLGPLHGANPALVFYPSILLAAVLLGWQEATAVLLAAVAVGSFRFVPPGRQLLPLGWLLVGGLNIGIIARLQRLAQELTAANERQRILFQELQHRVANTLQSVTGTFEIAQTRMQSSPTEAAALLANAATRITAAAEVHRRLHDPALFQRGLEEILRDAVAAAVDRRTVEPSIRVEPLALSFDQMSALTMLVIEAANNAQKHVFQHGLGSMLEVSLTACSDGWALLTVRDDGPGWGAVADVPATGGGLGMRILEGLARQLSGTLHIGSGPGRELSVEFPLRQPRRRSLRRL